MECKPYATVLGALTMLLWVSGDASAISRYNSKSVTCHQAHELIASQGAVIFRYPSKRNPGLTLYNRFVAHAGKCAFGEQPALQSVPTADRSSCRLIFCSQRNGRGGGRKQRFNGNVQELCTIDAVPN